MTKNPKYILALNALKDKNIYANTMQFTSGEIINLYVVDYTLSRNKLMEDIRGIVGDEFLVSYVPVHGEIIIQLKNKS